MTINTRNRADLYASIALLIGGPLFAILSIFTTGTTPLQILFFGLILFGVFSYAATAGLEKPLIRMLMVAVMFCTYGYLTFKLDADPRSQINAAILYLMALFIGIFLWGGALLHRPGPAKRIGAAGLMFGLGPLALLIAGHVVLGFGGVVGVQAIWAAQASGTLGDLSFLNLAHGGLGIWALACGVILYSGLLRR